MSGYRNPTAGTRTYRVIVFAVALFLVVDLGVLVLNTLVSTRLERDALAVNLAGRQRMLSQQMTKALFQAHDAVEGGADPEPHLAEFRRACELFDTTLATFPEGGAILGPEGEPAILDVVLTPGARSALATTETLWAPFRPLAAPLLASPGAASPVAASGGAPVGVEEHLGAAAAYLSVHNRELLRLSNALTSEMEAVARGDARRLWWIEGTGIALALLNFLVILFYLLRRFRAQDAQLLAHRRHLEKAKAEADEILDTVGEGLLLLDREGRIQSQYSRALAGILGRSDLAGIRLIDLLGPHLSEKMAATSGDYLELLFSRRVKEKTLERVNPLSEVEVFQESEGGSPRTKHLRFTFRRVLEEGEVAHVLVTVADATEAVELARQLAESEQRARTRLEVLLSILHVEPTLLEEFLTATERRLAELNHTLKMGSHPGAHLYVIDALYRIAHTIKGDASVLNLRSFEEAVHEFEEELRHLREAGVRGGDDFLAVAMALDRLRELYNSVRDLLARIRGLRTVPSAPAGASAGASTRVSAEVSAEVSSGETAGKIAGKSPGKSAGEIARQAPAGQEPGTGDPPPNGAGSFNRRLAALVERMAREQGKKAVLRVEGFDLEAVPDSFRAGLSDILIQLVRNSVSHGIEPPLDRLDHAKDEVGHIELRAERSPDHRQLTVRLRDDGRGIQLAAIRRMWVQQGRATPETVATLPPPRLVQSIFEPGFSTAEGVTLGAGRGVGMDVVLRRVREMGGQIRVRFAEGKYSEFSVALPAA